MDGKFKVCYIYSDQLAEATSKIPNIKNRGRIVHELISAYELTKWMKTVETVKATDEDILTFHSKEYFEILCSTSNGLIGQTNCDITGNTSVDEEEEDLDSNGNEEEEYGLGYDCPLFNNMDKMAKLIVGGTLQSANLLIEGERIVINWLGGWHHAQRTEASGFCYVNDIVIAIQHLQKKFQRILYIDLDAHHGDGVQDAFSYTNKVLTLSLHNYEAGYFPGTGNIQEIGFGKGKYHSVNVPLKSGITDTQYFDIFQRVFELVKLHFPFEVIVVQAGADCIVGDPLGAFNLTPIGLGKCISQILKANTPTIFLGGGGYNHANSAKCWTYLTSLILGKTINSDIPEHKYFSLYGPSFELDISPNLVKNKNTQEYLDWIYSNIQVNLKNIKGIN